MFSKPLMLPMLGILTATMLHGCADTVTADKLVLNPPIGEYCHVRLKPEAIGGTDQRLSPMTQNINGTETGVGGELSAIDGDWVVVKTVDVFQKKQEVWIVRDMVLLITIPTKQPEK